MGIWAVPGADVEDRDVWSMRHEAEGVLGEEGIGRREVHGVVLLGVLLRVHQLRLENAQHRLFLEGRQRARSASTDAVTKGSSSR
jgi:hypothetical protein